MKTISISEEAYKTLFKYKAQKELATGKRQSVGRCASTILEHTMPKILAGETVSEKDLII